MKKGTIAWIAAAAVLVLIIVFRVDERLFDGSSVKDGIQQNAETFTSNMKSARAKLETMVQEKDFSKFKLTDPTLIVDETQPGAPAEASSTLHVSGVYNVSGGESMASVNGSLVKKGSSVRGCEVLDVTQEGVLFLISGEKILVPVYGDYSFEKVKMGSLTLEKVENRGGDNLAIINGKAYKAGDWVDGDTVVKAVTPTMVMVNADGKSTVLKIGDSL